MVTVSCPICGEVITLTEFDTVSRTDALMGHIVKIHGGQARPATPYEGPPLPRALRIKWPWRR
jgi:hypothetical protein